MIDLLGFVRTYLGKPGVGDTAANQGQCVGLIEVYLDCSKKPHIWGNACDLLANAPVPPYKVTQNTPVNYPSAGDVLVWGSSWGGGAGHTAVVLAANVSQVVVFEQNNPDHSPPVVATHDYSGVLGWLSF
jgi:hypothetical protein